MAEEKVAQVVKKKGNKLVIVGIAVAMLVTGGFFGLKMRGGSAKKTNEVKLGEIVTMKEFLVNVRSLDDTSKVYLRTEIALQLPEKYQKEKFTSKTEPVADAINKVLRDTTVDDIKKPEGTDKLKRRIAAAANRAIALANGDDKGAPKITPNKDWDSDTSPVLKVYFTSFAFQ